MREDILCVQSEESLSVEYGGAAWKLTMRPLGKCNGAHVPSIGWSQSVLTLRISAIESLRLYLKRSGLVPRNRRISQDAEPQQYQICMSYIRNGYVSKASKRG